MAQAGDLVCYMTGRVHDGIRCLQELAEGGDCAEPARDAAGGRRRDGRRRRGRRQAPPSAAAREEDGA